MMLWNIHDSVQFYKANLVHNFVVTIDRYMCVCIRYQAWTIKILNWEYYNKATYWQVIQWKFTNMMDCREAYLKHAQYWNVHDTGLLVHQKQDKWLNCGMVITPCTYLDNHISSLPWQLLIYFFAHNIRSTLHICLFYLITLNYFYLLR